MLNAVPKPQPWKKPDRAQLAARAKLLESLTEELQSQEIYGCEVCYLENREGKRQRPDPRCFPIDPAHRHDRDDYRLYPSKLWTKNQVILAGRAHHTKMDSNKDWREEIFLKLRGEDAIRE